MYLRVRMAKGREIMFVSHLDFTRTWERALRRAKIPMAMTEGFNPHPRMSFGPPLSVGITSNAEYADLELVSEMKADDFINAIKPAVPPGLSVTAARLEENKPASLMGTINREDYLLSLEVPPEVRDKYTREIRDLFEKKELMIERTGPKGKKVVDIRPLLEKVELNENGRGNLQVFIRSVIGPNGNFRPKDLLFLWPEVALIQQHRQALWIKTQEILEDPLSAWEVKR